MLTCIGCSTKHVRRSNLHQNVKVKDTDDYDDDDVEGTMPGDNKPLVKTLTAQIKELAVKASGAYRSCKPCKGPADREGGYYSDSEETYSAKNHCSYRRTFGSGSTSKLWDKEIEPRLKGMISSGETTPASSRSQSLIFADEDEPKEWIAHVEPGVLITFVSLPEGGNELKRIRFSRDMFDKWQAQLWWTENYDKIIELYNVQRFNQQTVPLQTPQTPGDEVSNVQTMRGAPRTPPLSNERMHYSMIRSKRGENTSSDSLDHHTLQSHQHDDPNDAVSTPKASNLSGARTDTSSVGASARSSSSYETDHSGQPSVSNASDLESEWVEQDEPGVYITIRESPGGIRELRRVRFSREKFGEMHARLWWEENRARIQEQYL